jgi:hypothetical protein
MGKWEILEGLLRITTVLIRAIRSGDDKTVEDILPETLRTSLAQAAARAEASEKFGREED